MSRRTYITLEEKKIKRSTKPIKNRLNLLLCTNENGELKMHPLLVYHPETPTVFRKHDIIQNRLGIMWRSNSKALVTKALFVEWTRETFCPTVK